jgi:HrpA-like RNA helicase
MKSFEPGSAVSMWLTTLISKSSARQRAGRCGRLPGTTGTCYHLFSRKTFDEIMLNEQAPELVRIPIPEICLSAKMLGGDIKIEEFLSKAPDPPAQKTISNAVEELKALGAIEQNEDLTPLGRLLVDMPLDPRLGKAVLGREKTFFFVFNQGFSLRYVTMR